MKKFTDNYYITENGEVYSSFNGKKRRLKTQITEKGYERIKIQGKMYQIHRLVAMNFIPNPNNLPQVNHKDCNKLNNCVDNLEWCDNSKNQKHAWDNSLQPRLREVPNRALTLEQAELIRKEYSTGKTSQRKLAEKYNVSKTTIADLLKGKYYNHSKENKPLVKNINTPKLTLKQANEIRERYKNENISLNKLGKEYNVDHKTIKRIIDNKSYVQ